MFDPRSIAVVGASTNIDAMVNRNFLKPLVDHKYRGKIYPVNPRADEILGLEAYPSINQIPETVDFVVCAVPAEFVSRVVEECVEKEVKVIHIYSAGFSETGEPEGRELEQRIAHIACRGGVRIIGPNCIGIYCPSTGMSFYPNLSKEAGHMAFISQSGGFARGVTLMGEKKGIRFSKVVSYGNACDLNEADFLQYLANDAETKTIGAYIEGVKSGPRFVEALSEAAKKKPVIVIKGGRTTAGTRAVASHTGSMAGTDLLWDAICRQAGAIRVYDPTELIDLAEAFSYMRVLQGKRVGIICIGGGESVQAADECEAAGLVVPSFSQRVRQELLTVIDQVGTSVRNPVDTRPALADSRPFVKMTTMLTTCDEIDIVIIQVPVTPGLYPQGDRVIMGEIEAFIEASKSSSKPVTFVLPTYGSVDVAQFAFKITEKCHNAGFPVYPLVRDAAKAISRMAAYRQMNAVR
jgi:acyl-CoA synthetase (NDP forming)